MALVLNGIGWMVVYLILHYAHLVFPQYWEAMAVIVFMYIIWFVGAAFICVGTFLIFFGRG